MENLYILSHAEAPRWTVPSGRELRKNALMFLREKNRRLSLALALMLCLAVSVVLLFGLITLDQFFFGKEDLYWDDLTYYLVQYGITVGAVFLSLPLYHGFRICAANAVKTGEVNLLDLFLPFTSVRLFFSSLLVSSMYMLPYLAAYCVFICGVLYESWGIILLSDALFPLFYLVTKVPRRVCRMHGCFYDRGLRFAFRAARMCPPEIKKAHGKLSFASVPSVLLSVATLLMYGIYGAFAQYTVASSMLYLNSVDIIDSRKDIPQ